MPRPRFYKLANEKQETILEAAAREIAKKGYENASLNHILLSAGLSKGAAYYYFDDKADLFITAVTHYRQIVMRDVIIDIDALTADNFWHNLTDIYRQQFYQAQKRPWVFGAIKSVNSLPAERLTQEPFAAFTVAMRNTLPQLLSTGQALGAVRQDLPDELLYKLVMAIDDVYDQWLLPQWAEMDEDEIETAVSGIIKLLQQLLTP